LAVTALSTAVMESSIRMGTSPSKGLFPAIVIKTVMTVKPNSLMTISFSFKPPEPNWDLAL